MPFLQLVMFYILTLYFNTHIILSYYETDLFEKTDSKIDFKIHR